MINRGIQNTGIVGIGAHVEYAQTGVVGKYLPPGLPAVLGTKNSAVTHPCRFLQRPPKNAESEGVAGHYKGVRISRVNDDRLDVRHVLQADVGPRRAAVR